MGGSINPTGEDANPLRRIAPEELGAVLISHVHQDHNGEIVFLPKGGLTGPIYMHDFSKKATNIITNDNLRTQEETISAINKKSKSDWDQMRKAANKVRMDRGTNNTRVRKVRNG